VELALPATPCRIRADREALGRALWNLLDNSVKYSPANRTVWVEVALEGDRLSISVRDRGMGIPAAEQKAIFEKFVRGAHSRETGVKGTGLGLAIVRHVVAAHGGEVRLESAPGEGSRFTLRIPLEPEP
jgi:two-component system sensor histidine kinase SenX3